MTTIKLSQKVRVSDPCYDNDVWCKTRLKNVLPGAYNWSVNHTDLGDWGNRVSSITLIHENYRANDSLMWDYHSDIGVDSGQAGIFCETSYRNDEVAAGITTPDIDFPFGEDGPGEAWYVKMCKFTLGSESFGAYDTGVVSSSGIGDGSYPLYVVYDNNHKIVAMQIDYLPEDDEDEGDVCGICGNDMVDGESCNCQDEETQD